MPTYNVSTDYAGEGFAGIASLVIEGHNVPDDLLDRVKGELQTRTEYLLGRWHLPRLPKEAFGVRTLIWKVDRDVDPPVHQVSRVRLTLRCWVNAKTPVSGLDVTFGELGAALLGVVLDELRLQALNAEHTETPVSSPADAADTDKSSSPDGIVQDLMGAVDRFADGLAGLLGDLDPAASAPDFTLDRVAATLFEDAARLVRTISLRLNSPQSSDTSATEKE